MQRRQGQGQRQRQRQRQGQVNSQQRQRQRQRQRQETETNRQSTEEEPETETATDTDTETDTNRPSLGEETATETETETERRRRAGTDRPQWACTAGIVAFHTPSSLIPIGFKSEWMDSATGLVYECEVQDGQDVFEDPKPAYQVPNSLPPVLRQCVPAWHCRGGPSRVGGKLRNVVTTSMVESWKSVQVRRTPVVLRIRYAMSGPEIACGYAMSGTGIWYGYAMSGAEIVYRDAMSGTELADGETGIPDQARDCGGESRGGGLGCREARGPIRTHCEGRCLVS
eukprot:114429-Rhodomonas_salina.1